MRAELVRREGGTWALPRIRSTGALLSLSEFPAMVLAAGSETESLCQGASLGVSWQRCLNNLHLLSGNDGVRRVDNDLIIRLEAGDDLDLIAEIVPWSHSCEHDFPVFNNAGTQALGTEKQSIDRKQQCGSLPWDLQMDLRVRATEQRASGIVHFNFDQQGPGRQVNG